MKEQENRKSEFGNAPDRRRQMWGIIWLCLAALMIFPSWMRQSVLAADTRQQPSPSMATVTGTPSGPIGKAVLDQEEINVRSGPGTDVFPRVGVLLPGQDVPVLGRSPGGDWLQVVYPGIPGNSGWVYYAFIVLPSGVNLPIIEPPSTPTPAVTATIDATLAAQFIVNQPPTRLPTFTAAPPISVPTFEVASNSLFTSDIPMGLPIAVLFIVGLLGALLTMIRG